MIIVVASDSFLVNAWLYIDLQASIATAEKYNNLINIRTLRTLTTVVENSPVLDTHARVHTHKFMTINIVTKRRHMQ